MIPDKIKAELLADLVKNKSFCWYQGWERESGYVKSYLTRNDAYNNVRVYCEWKKKKDPTPEQQDELLAKELDAMIAGTVHPMTRKDFRFYVIDKYFKESRKSLDMFRHTLADGIGPLITALERSEDFVLPIIQNIHNELKNIQCQLDTEEAIERFTTTLQEKK